jgi:hypothetical protein
MNLNYDLVYVRLILYLLGILYIRLGSMKKLMKEDTNT